MQSHLKCPKCGTRLIIKGYSQYETLCEHVMDPNAENLPLKPRFKCLKRCYPRKYWWGIDGGLYSDTPWLQRLLWKFGIYGIFKDIEVPDAAWEKPE